jgi:hypothetical protein
METDSNVINLSYKMFLNIHKQNYYSTHDSGNWPFVLTEL